MKAIRNRFALHAVSLAALFSFAIGAPAHAVVDYTIDCSQTQGPPYEDTDPDPGIWYSSYHVDFDGTQERTVTVNIVNCDYHSVRDDPSGWIFQDYVGTVANVDYTVTIPIGDHAEVGGYNTSPAQTNFTIRFGNDPTGGGGDGGNETDALAQTGSTDVTSALLVGAFVGAVGLSLSLIRRRNAQP